MRRRCFGQALVGLDQSQAMNCFENATVMDNAVSLPVACSGAVYFPGLSLAAGNNIQNFLNFSEVSHTTAGMLYHF